MARSSASSPSWASCSSTIASSLRRLRKRAATWANRRSVRHDPISENHTSSHSRDTVHDWIGAGRAMLCVMPTPTIITERLDQLEANLPAVPARIVNLQRTLAGFWYDRTAAVVGAFAGSTKTFFDTARVSGKTVSGQARAAAEDVAASAKTGARTVTGQAKAQGRRISETGRARPSPSSTQRSTQSTASPARAPRTSSGPRPSCCSGPPSSTSMAGRA